VRTGDLPELHIARLTPSEEFPKLRSIIDKLYRIEARIGSGSSADAFRADGSHGQKLVDSIRGLEKVLRHPGLSDADRRIAEHLINDMKNALSGK
jgi:filamentous hemagglutinin